MDFKPHLSLFKRKTLIFQGLINTNPRFIPIFSAFRRLQAKNSLWGNGLKDKLKVLSHPAFSIAVK
jgi:hypothetical protein